MRRVGVSGSQNLVLPWSHRPNPLSSPTFFEHKPHRLSQRFLVELFLSSGRLDWRHNGVVITSDVRV